MDARKRFAAVSWFVCTFLSTVPFAIASIVDNDPKNTVAMYVGGWALAWLYFCLPYAIYDSQVTGGKKPGAVLFALITGIIFGILMVLFWDFLRFVLSKIMNPGGSVRYATKTPGVLRR